MDPDDIKNSKLTISIGGKEITPSSTYTYDTSIDTNDIVYTGASSGGIDSSIIAYLLKNITKKKNRYIFHIF